MNRLLCFFSPSTVPISSTSKKNSEKTHNSRSQADGRRSDFLYTHTYIALPSRSRFLATANAAAAAGCSRYILQMPSFLDSYCQRNLSDLE